MPEKRRDLAARGGRPEAKRVAVLLPEDAYGAIRARLLSFYRKAFLTRKSLALLLAGLGACSELTEPRFPGGAIPMVPPRAYGLWWSLTEECSGVTRDFSAVRWYVLPGTAQFEVGGKLYQSYWWSAGNRIVVAAPAKLDGRLIRHEMLHALTGARHTHDYFVDRCGGVVVCSADCIAEAGDFAAPPADAAVIQSTGLDVTVEVDPIGASIAADSGWIAISVSVKNQLNYPVWVQLDRVAPAENSSAAFGYVLDCLSVCGGGSEYTYIRGDRFGFSAGQTRRYVFDRQLPAGDFSVRGFFNTDTTLAKTFSIAALP